MQDFIQPIRTLKNKKSITIVSAVFVLFLITVLPILILKSIAPKGSSLPKNNSQKTNNNISLNYLTGDTLPYIDEEEWNFVNILNTHRESLGRQKVKVSVKLSEAATWMSQDMADHNRFDHVDSLGRNLKPRLTFFGYTGNSGENIASVGSTGQSAYSTWLASTQGHKEEMENASRRALGISRVKGTGSNWLWTADFGDSLDAEITPDASTSPTTTPTQGPDPQSTPTITPTPSGTTSVTPTSGPTPTTDPNDTVLKFSYFLPGIGVATGDNSNPVDKNRTTTIQLFDSHNLKMGSDKTTAATYNSATGKYEGVLNLGVNFTTGLYLVKIKVNNSLIKRVAGIVTITATTSTSSLPSRLITGDIDQDNNLSITDYNLIVACYQGVAICTQEIEARADIDGDGVTRDDLDDFAIVQRGFVTVEGD